MTSFASCCNYVMYWYIVLKSVTLIMIGGRYVSTVFFLTMLLSLFWTLNSQPGKFGKIWLKLFYFLWRKLQDKLEVLNPVVKFPNFPYFPNLTVLTNFKYHETLKLSVVLFPIISSKLIYILKRHYKRTEMYPYRFSIAHFHYFRTKLILLINFFVNWHSNWHCIVFFS